MKIHRRRGRRIYRRPADPKLLEEARAHAKKIAPKGTPIVLCTLACLFVDEIEAQFSQKYEREERRIYATRNHLRHELDTLQVRAARAAARAK